LKQWLKKHLKLPRIKPKLPYINDEKLESIARETGLILFFCITYVGIYGYDWRLANIICGAIGCWFFYPRAGR
jgi:hypothetical protein